MSTWTVTWQRAGDPAVQTCKGLTPEVALFRLRNALKEASITVLSVEHEMPHHRGACCLHRDGSWPTEYCCLCGIQRAQL